MEFRLRRPAAMIVTATAKSRASGEAPDHWTQLAAVARAALAGVRFGHREVELRRLAAAFGVNPQTLRRALAALKFVETIEADRFLKKLSLRAAPVAAIEHLARWHAYDRESALRAARLLADRHYTVAALGAAERTARVAAHRDGIGRSLLHACRLRVGPVLRAQFKDHAFDEQTTRRSDEPSVDFRFRAPGAKSWTVAAIIMGPYRDQKLYETRLGDFIVRALGLGIIYPRIILVVPTAAVRKRCLVWMRGNGVREDAFDIQIISRKP
jgi:hypothetical protein